jgi:hypothetical protein
VVEFSFHGVEPSLRFRSELTGSDGPWISVDAIRQGKVRDGLAQFYGAEILTDKGWVSLGARPEFQRYWNTKEELWIDWCFERFLMWFNRSMN